MLSGSLSRRVGLCGLLLWILGPQGVVVGTAGELDPAFGSGGVVSTSFSAHDVSIQSNGKIVVAGFQSVGGGNSDFAVARYNADGTLDSSFGLGGLVTADFNGFNDEAFAVALQSDGRIVVAGTAGSSAGTHIALARFNVDGSLDMSFGVGGLVVDDLGNTEEVIRSIALQADSKIVAAGHANVAGVSDFVVVRYNSDGSPDTTFGVGGAVTTDFVGNADEARDLVLQPDGRIVVCGATTTVALDGIVGLARYDSNGALDPTFGTGGLSTVPLFSDGGAVGIALQTDGELAVAAVEEDPFGQFILLRFGADGTLDSSFAGGIATVYFLDVLISGTQQDASARDIAIQPDGKIVVAGWSGGLAVARVLPNGGVDTLFNAPDGWIRGIGSGVGRAVALQSDGKIVVVGDGTLARFLVDVPDTVQCVPGSGSGTTVYSNTETRFDDRIGGVLDEFGDDLHLIRSGNMTSFEFSILPCGLPSPFSVVVHFYNNDADDGLHQPGEAALLPASDRIASVVVPNIVRSSPGDCEEIVTVCAELPTPIPLPQDIWMTVEVSNAHIALFPLSRGPELGTSHSLVYSSSAFVASNFLDAGTFGFGASAQLDFAIRMEAAPADTPEGSNVAIEPEPGVTLTFSNVTTAGATTVMMSDSNPGSGISGFEFLGTFYEIETNAAFNGNVELCLDYDDSGLSAQQEAALQLMHYDGMSWSDITSDLDTVNNVICGITTSFSLFAVGHPIPSVAQELLGNLIEKTAALNINSGILNSLDAKLEAAAAALDDFNTGNDVAAQMNLNAFINAVQAQSGGHIPVPDANELIQDALDILMLL